MRASVVSASARRRCACARSAGRRAPLRREALAARRGLGALQREQLRVEHDQRVAARHASRPPRAAPPARGRRSPVATSTTVVSKVPAGLGSSRPEQPASSSRSAATDGERCVRAHSPTVQRRVASARRTRVRARARSVCAAVRSSCVSRYSLSVAAAAARRPATRSRMRCVRSTRSCGEGLGGDGRRRARAGRRRGPRSRPRRRRRGGRRSGARAAAAWLAALARAPASQSGQSRLTAAVA